MILQRLFSAKMITGSNFCIIEVPIDIINSIYHSSTKGMFSNSKFNYRYNLEGTYYAEHPFIDIF